MKERDYYRILPPPPPTPFTIPTGIIIKRLNTVYKEHDMLTFPLRYSRDSCVRFYLQKPLLMNLRIFLCTVEYSTLYSILPFSHSA
jgi:hypothetical protein